MQKLIIFIGLLVIAMSFQVQSSAANKGTYFKVDRKLADALTAAVEEVNKQSPKMLDQETRLDSAATHANVIIYTNTVVNYTVSELNPDKFDEVIKTEVIDTLCSNKELLYFQTQGVIMVYRYLDKNGVYISEQYKDMSTCR